MKFSLTLGFATSASLLALSSPSAAATVKAPSPQTCGDRSHAVPFYFSELPGQAVYYTTLTSDVELLVTPLGYTFRGVAALVFTTQEPSTVPFYHVRNIQAVDNLYTTSVIERDTAVENGDIDGPIAAYIYPSQICGSVPFYRLYSNAATEHYYTINATDQAARVASGVWADEGIAGYVLDLNLCA
ncbi:hypothetical protein C8J57DRAFT_1183450 [Mycena rebaudengoi]|nr:hypothetical protein C8J57DRAFT_1183450 [Mycena rebaudengoi]